MDLNKFLSDALTPIQGQRAGQAFMNSVSAIHPHLYRDLLSMQLDAFYDDGKLWSAVEWITRNSHNYFAVQDQA